MSVEALFMTPSFFVAIFFILYKSVFECVIWVYIVFNSIMLFLRKVSTLIDQNPECIFPLMHYVYIVNMCF